ncbi:MAG: hypothetical protein QOG71_2339 [Pyrinomonadaceae bacterium]|nr:hypothetical protein [Pyrinomonadaceae bacterium]
MKSYRNALAAVVLAFVFSTSTFAGEGVMWTEKTPPPPPPQANGLIWTDKAAPASKDDTLMEITLSVLQTLIPLL